MTQVSPLALRFLVKYQLVPMETIVSSLEVMFSQETLAIFRRKVVH